MTKVRDSIGTYDPTLNKCGCIDKSTLTDLDHSLRILYSDKFSERNRLRKEKKDTSEIDLLIERTANMQDVVRSIDGCDYDIIKVNQNLKMVHKLPKCDCQYPIKRIEEISSMVLDDIELYKDITVGGATILDGSFKEITPIDVIGRIEEKTKDLLVQKKEYENCCGD